MEEELKIHFAEVIKSIRLEKGYSQQKLCDLANIERVVLSRIERKISVPSQYTLFKISKVLEIKPSEILERVESKI